jgi:hypothetical protein
MPKIVHDDVVMVTLDDADNKSECKIMMVCNDQYETIQTVSLLFKSTKTSHFTYHKFSLVVEKDRHKNIVFQLETFPDWESSHRELGLTYKGSHCHELDNAYEIRAENEHWDWYNWLDDFAKRANVSFFGDRIPPFDGALF